MNNRQWIGKLGATAGLVAICLGCAATAQMMWRSGSGVVADSVTYVDKAKSLLAGNGLSHRWAFWDPVYETCQLPTRTSLWPPGVSLGIASLSGLGLNPYAAGRLLSMLSFIALPLPIYGLARLLLKPARAVLCTFSAVFVFQVAMRSASVTSDLPFLVLGTSAAFFSVRASLAASPKRATGWWLAASTVAGAALLCRYVGIACVVSVAIVSFLASRRLQGRGRWATLTAGIVPGSAVAGVVFLRNVLLSGSPGLGVPGSNKFLSLFPHTMRAVAGAFLGEKALLEPTSMSVLRPIQLILLGVITIAAVLSVFQCLGARRTRCAPEARTRASWVSGVMGVFLSVYLLVLICSLANFGMPGETRYFTIVMPWYLLIVGTWALRQGVPRSEGRWQRVAATAAVVSCMLLAVCQYMVLVRFAHSREESEIIRMSEASPTIAWAKANIAPDEVMLVSRKGVAIAYVCPNPTLELPRSLYSAVRATSWRAVDNIAMKAGAHYLIHLRGYQGAFEWDPDTRDFWRLLDLPHNFHNRDHISFEDGIIYKVGQTSRMPE